MIRSVGMWIGTFVLIGAVQAFAQEAASGPGPVEVTITPAGGTFFMSKGARPRLGCRAGRIGVPC